MSFAQSQVRSLSDDIVRIHKKIADISHDEARMSAKIADLNARLVRATSSSQIASYSRDIQRAQSDFANLVKKRADESKNLARKQEELARRQKDVVTEQERAILQQNRILQDLQNSARNVVDLSLSRVNTGHDQAEEEYDAFISHASEDKEHLVRPLAKALIDAGFKVWYDELSITLGDSLRRTIDRGLARSRFGIVVLSPEFLSKNWPQYELDGLVAREMQGQKVILPLWHHLSKDDVMRYSPALADKVALNTTMYTINEMAEKIGEVLGKH